MSSLVHCFVSVRLILCWMSDRKLGCTEPVLLPERC